MVVFITVSEMKPYSTWEITRAKIANSVLLCQTSLANVRSLLLAQNPGIHLKENFKYVNTEDSFSVVANFIVCSLNTNTCNFQEIK